MSYFLNTTQLLMFKIPCQCTTKLKSSMTLKMTMFILQRKINVFITGIIIVAKLYYDFVDALKFEHVYSNLTKKIGNRGKFVS